MLVYDHEAMVVVSLSGHDHDFTGAVLTLTRQIRGSRGPTFLRAARGVEDVGGGAERASEFASVPANSVMIDKLASADALARHRHHVDR